MKNPEVMFPRKRSVRRLTSALALSGTMLLVGCGGDEKIHANPQNTATTTSIPKSWSTPGATSETTSTVPIDTATTVPGQASTSSVTETTLARPTSPQASQPNSPGVPAAPNTTSQPSRPNQPTQPGQPTPPTTRPNQAPSATTPTTAKPVTPSARVVYYQPRLSDLHDPRSTQLPAGVVTMVAETGKPNTWPIGNCRPDGADDFVAQTQTADTLVGFSLGRVGVPYFLQQATPQLKNQIDNIVIIAPGNQEDFTDSCDPANTGELVRGWLESDADHRLTVVTDDRTEEADNAGIRNLYLNALAGSSAIGRVSLCAANDGSHEGSWNGVKAGVVADPRTCPAGSSPVGF